MSVITQVHTSTCTTILMQANYKKMDVKISKNAKIQSPNFWQNYFFLEGYTIELIEIDDNTHDSNYIRNYMRPNFI